MDFVLSKLLWLAVNPGNALLTLVLLGLVFGFSRRRRDAGRRLALFSALLMLALSVFPVGRWLFVPLENRFPAAALPETVAGVVVLGGFVDPVLSAKTGQVEMGGAVERLVAMIDLSRRYPQAKIVFSGGSGSVLHPEASEAPLVKRLLSDIGVDAKAVHFEGKSRNTFENAVYSREIAKPQNGENWLLVTSAAHMPRAVGCFRKQGWEVIPWPVDHVSDGVIRLDPDFNLAGRLGLLGAAIHEWLGLISYALMGRTSELFPGP